jgi:hypothetical protein
MKATSKANEAQPAHNQKCQHQRYQAKKSRAYYKNSHTNHCTTTNKKLSKEAHQHQKRYITSQQRTNTTKTNQAAQKNITIYKTTDKNGIAHPQTQGNNYDTITLQLKIHSTKLDKNSAYQCTTKQSSELRNK